MNLLKVERAVTHFLRSAPFRLSQDTSPARVVFGSAGPQGALIPWANIRHLSTTSPRPIQQVQVEVDESNTLLTSVVPESSRNSDLNAKSLSTGLPRSCPGCGALTQESEPEQAGFYSSTRRRVKIYLRRQRSSAKQVENASDEALEEREIAGEDENSRPQDPLEQSEPSPSVDTPVCDRCHDLIHNSRGSSIAHPSIDSIADSIAESPFKRNHIYHVIDAADFPMSFVPELFKKLTLAKPRSQNRRSQHDFSTKPTISFIVTRSDLLGSTKEMVDGTMTYFQTVLRQVLGRAGRDMRLGNIHLVSAKRGWWTKEIKEDIWKRGGANWMVGKVNVGKSNLFEVLFPKGSGDRAPVYAELQRQQGQGQEEQPEQGHSANLKEDDLLSESALLPPVQAEVPFPVMPIVSSLPGTTASPIRLSFGGHKGELIDLPGLARGNLEDYVKPEHKLDLVMTHRHNVEQCIVKPGQSIVLGGGLIRITPQLNMEDRSTTVLAYAFVPLKSHVTSTEKAIALQLQERESGVESILEQNAGTCMASAGIFELSTDVTKTRSGPLTRAGVAVSKLAFRIYSTDILLEGVGWIELVCQVRRGHGAQLSRMLVAHENEEISDKDPPSSGDHLISGTGFAPFARQPPLEEQQDFPFPKVEIFSPLGKHVSQRPCIQAWMRWNGDGKQRNAMQARRRTRGSKGVKKSDKMAKSR